MRSLCIVASPITIYAIFDLGNTPDGITLDVMAYYYIIHIICKETQTVWWGGRDEDLFALAAGIAAFTLNRNKFKRSVDRRGYCGAA